MKTEELVYSLLDGLNPAKDEIPSVRTIREKLGKGSYGTISAALRNWKKSHAFAEAVRVDSEIELDEETLREFAETLSKIFGPIIRSRVDRVKREDEAEIARLATSLKQANLKLEEEINKREALEDELDKLRKELDEERLAKARVEGAFEAMTRSALLADDKAKS